MSAIKHIGVATAALLALAVGPAAVLAHGGEDHGAPAAVVAVPLAAAQAGFAAEGSAFQVVLVPGEAKTAVYLAASDTNVPVVGATIDVEAGAWQGPAQATRSPGVYELAWVPPHGRVDVSLMILGDGKDDLVLVTTTDPVAPVAAPVAAAPAIGWQAAFAAGGGGAVLAVGGLVVARRNRRAGAATLAVAMLAAAGPALAHGGEDHGAAAAAPQVAAGAPISMSKPTQFLLGIRTERVAAREVADTVRVLGHVVPDPSAYARVQPSQPARVAADPDYPIPVPGEAVKKGQVLAVLEPTLSNLERGDKRASLTKVESELAIAEHELARQETLAGLIPAKQIETTRIRLDQLRRERGQITGTSLGREYLRAPIDGVVTDVHLVPGEVVVSTQSLVEVVDPTRLRIEAVIHDLPVAKRISGATAASNLLPGQVFSLALLGVSPRLDPVDQGLHAVFRVTAADARDLSIGMPVDVYLATGATRMRTAVPRDAVAELGGRQVVFVRTAPEIFEARPVKVGPTVGPLAEVSDGVKSGDRVVVQGIEQLKAGR